MERTFTILLLTIVLLSCKKDPAIPAKGITETSTLEEDRKFLSALNEEITQLSNSVPCTNPSDWKITGYGAKPCGGPWGYIAYSKKIDEQAFLEKVAFYNAQESKYNGKAGMFSDCALTNQPSRVECVDGKAVLVY